MSWDDDLARGDAAVAGYFDTGSFTAIPMCKPGLAVNASADEADPTRESFVFAGSLEFGPEMSAMTGARTAGAQDRNVRQVFRACLTALATGWPWVPRQGDRIEAGTTLYLVAANAERDGTGRLVFWLNGVTP
ncbi:hypothetical protein FHS55_002130 [Angulomicrobium tetraedrale]|uniref:Uncharacterized protein n=1 Tax=Ancylobacter tetraedralis TaxID=217068 RepID=A0A839Z9W5_9HYPH|nr:hypothetical protein [Ancylobacter tetraedralis]MBB3771531.1 hypothetical protein [Ancylobacter tetraedralis]